MDGMTYQNDLLNALNKRLDSECDMYRTICGVSSCAFLYFDLRNNTVKHLGKWDEFFDFTLSSVNDFDNFISYYEDDHSYAIRELLLLEKRFLSEANLIVKKRDEGVWNKIDVNVIYENDIPVNKIVRVRNITKVRVQNEELKYMAHYDIVTGLYNRNYFVQILSGMIQNVVDDRDKLSIMFIDIDHFRKINDGMGMVYGDDLVQQFGQFLKSIISDDNIVVSHFNYDVFCIAIKNPYGLRSVENIYKKIHERCKRPFLLNGKQEVLITVSIGVASYPEASTNILDIINFAEIVMFKAKNNGRNKILYFDDVILNEFLKSIEMDKKIRSAIFEDNFVVYFQPQYSLVDNSLRGVEALVRMFDENGVLIPPGEFIKIAETNGLIESIGSWVLKNSIKIFSELIRRYRTDMILSINVSAIQFNNESFIKEVIDTIKEFDLDPNRVELELTESVLADNFEDVIIKMNTLREYGVRISLDDFGTGYSSLSYLRRLPIDTLKIDKCFVDSLIADKASSVILKTIVTMTKELGHETIAEGVETTKQLEFLKEIGCNYIQGFLLSKPLPAEELEKVIIRSLR